MPRFFDPEVDTVGPLGMKSRKSTARRSRKKGRGSTSRSKPLPPIASFDKAPESPIVENGAPTERLKSYIGQDLLELVSPEVASALPKKSSKVNSSGSTSKQGESRIGVTNGSFAKQNSEKTVNPVPWSVAEKYLGHSTATEITPEERDVPMAANATSKYLITSPHALAFDTRWLITNGDDACSETTAEHTVQYMKHLIRTLEARGAPPCFVAITKEVRKGEYGAIVSQHTTSVSNLLAPTFVQAQRALENDESVAISTPQALTAENSWAHFSDLVTSLASKGRSTVDASKKGIPMSVSIVTTDVALFCDTNVESHVNALYRFVTTVSPYNLESVQIIVAATASLGLLEAGNMENGKQRGDDEMHSNALQKHEDATNHCIDAIQAKLDELECAVTSRNGVGAGLGAPSLSISVIECSPVGFRFFSRQWVREALLNCTTGRLCFDLPETLEGTQCSVSLETSYQTFPFSIESTQATMLLADLRGLSKLEVLQLLPISSVDASLLFGIPMTVRAGLENDYEQFQETNALVRSLFKLLQEREYALLLQAPGYARSEGMFSSCNSSAVQLYVLMAQEPPKSLGESPCSGLLFRFAHADQLLGEATGSSGLGLLDKNEALEAQYTEYIDAALATLECSPFNPLRSLLPVDGEMIKKFSTDIVVVDSTAASVLPVPIDSHQLFDADDIQHQLETNDGDDMSIESHHTSQNESSVWNDASGVGACVAAMLTSGGDANNVMDNFDGNHDTSAFFD